MRHENIAIPEIKTIVYDSVHLYFDEDFSEVLLVNDQPILELQNYLKTIFSKKIGNFREQLIFKSVPFLVAVFSDEKEVRISGTKLAQELYLCHHYDDEDNSKFITFKNHVTKIATLSPQDSLSISQRITLTSDLVDLTDLTYLQKTYDYSNETMNKLRLKIREYSPSIFEQFSDYGLSLTANYAILRIHLLKFLAILPSLDYDNKGNEVKRVLLEALRRILEDHSRAKKAKATGDQAPLSTTLKLLFQIVHAVAYFLPAKTLSVIVRSLVRTMAKRFIAGETIEKAKDGLKDLYKSKRDATLDQLGELVVSEKEADNYRDEVIKLIKGFSLHVKKGEKNKAGINRAHVSIKVSALCSDFKPYAFDYSYKLVAPRLKEILTLAKEHDVFINIDAEHYHYRDIVFKIYSKVLKETEELKGFEATGIVVQAYLRDGLKHLKDVIELAKERKINMPIRLVKGAYWDAETIEAEAHGHNAPQFLNKEETDVYFRQLIFEILKSGESIQLCIASHNFADHSFAEAVRKEIFPDSPVIEHQCLHMTYEALSVALAKMGWPTRNYVPVGSLLVGMAYLVRRIMENSSQVGVLTIMRSHNNENAIKRPEEVHLEKISQNASVFDSTVAQISEDFSNVAPVRMYLDEELTPIIEAHEKFKKQDLGKVYKNEFTEGKNAIEIHSSSDPNIVVGKIAFGEREDAVNVIERSLKYYNEGDWTRTSWIERSSIMFKVATKLLMRRNELSALIVYEAGKTFSEALADVDEAIDFLNFYAREEGAFHKKHHSSSSRGVVVAITPWNFPLAIPCGMVCGPLVAGNSVILKSAEQTPLIAQKLVDIFHECGVPDDALIHIPGFGENVGDALVQDPRVSAYVFTGSKAVGTMIAEKAGKRTYKNKVFNYSAPVKVVTEMGGKNAIIVTANAEIDETVAGILYSAYGHAGQKCSAASRILVDNQVKDRLIERLKEASKDVKVGCSFDMSTSLNPVISHHDMERIQETVIDATEEALKYGGVVHIDRSKDVDQGYCVGPAIIELPVERAFQKGSHCRKEVFGPVIHIIGFKNLDQAVELYNSTNYALTGGIFSQSQDDIDYLSNKLESGNIYVNRSITGARVAIEPFGGFKLSGTGPKAGGKFYLPIFHNIPINLPMNKNLIEESLSDQKGSEYVMDLCSKVKGTKRENVLKVQRGLEEVLTNFENIFTGIYAENKQVLKDYKEWLKNEHKNLIYGTIANRTIPGQLSHNSYLFSDKRVVIVAHEKRAHFSTLIQFLTALSLGIGVTVLARNKNSEKWWNRVVSIFRVQGITKKSLDVFLPSESVLELIFEREDLKTIIIDGNAEKVELLLPKIINNQRKQNTLKKIITPIDCPSVDDFEATLLLFINVRSFAINTMRHGAPLSLEY